MKEERRRVIKTGNTLGITLPKDYIEKLGLRSGDVLRIEQEGETLVIRPFAFLVEGVRRNELRQAQA
ncbi:MAG: AbrB/MazE/SpoVT family DNA-binding domain-containing protein [Candidatus Hadarchaeales archaeon]